MPILYIFSEPFLKFHLIFLRYHGCRVAYMSKFDGLWQIGIQDFFMFYIGLLYMQTQSNSKQRSRGVTLTTAANSGICTMCWQVQDIFSVQFQLIDIFLLLMPLTKMATNQ